MVIGLDPIALFRRASAHAATVIAAVRPEQLAGPTPCTLWSVQDLIDHMVGGTSYLQDAMDGRPPRRSVPGSNAADFAAGLDAVLDGFARPGAMQRRCSSPLGFEWSVGEAVGGTFMDMLIHSWDLAVATGQDTRLDSDLVAACWQMFMPEMPERGRAGGLVGQAVTVPDDAPQQDRLLGAMGRQP
jgi:uncharacterized protein (TIGR03086 family)